MSKQTINTLKSWFKTGLKPLQQQFWDWMDSYWHKDEKIPVNNVEGLSEVLNNLPTTNALQMLQEQIVTHEANKNNPHDVTAAQLGLGEVNNQIENIQAKIAFFLPIETAPGQVSIDVPGNTLVEKILVLDDSDPVMVIIKDDDDTDITSGGLQVVNGWATLQMDIYFKEETRLYFNNITSNTVVKVFKR